jgi:PiT family inorganic phosphate transporter
VGGATFLSHHVELTVGQHIVPAARVPVTDAALVVLVAGGLTTLYTAYRIPSSTIQILVFSVVGMGVALSLPVNWHTIVLWLVSVWVFAPLAALVVAFVLTKLLDLVPRLATAKQDGTGGMAGAGLRTALVGASLLAAITLGANDVANASGALSMTRLSSATSAGLAMGTAMPVGALTWGRPLLRKVAFDIVRVDLAMATAAQLSLAVVGLAAAWLGVVTSMNQSLVGAMAGAGLARHPDRIDWKALTGILKGWLIGPPLS